MECLSLFPEKSQLYFLQKYKREHQTNKAKITLYKRHVQMLRGNLN